MEFEEFRKIEIINLSSFETEIEFDERSNYINSLDNNRIVSVNLNNDIEIIKINATDYQKEITIKSETSLAIKKITPISNQRLMCTSFGSTKIYNAKPPHKCLVTLKSSKGTLLSPGIEVKNRKCIVTGNPIQFWDNENYNLEKEISPGKCVDIIEIKNDKILIGGNSSFQIIDLHKLEVEKTFKVGTDVSIKSFIYLSDETVLCGCGGKAGSKIGAEILNIDLFNDKIIGVKKEVEKREIYQMINFATKRLLTLSTWSNSIKIWEY